MDQTHSLSEALLKGSSALGGFLSQMNGVSGSDSVLSGLFSSLVSNDVATQDAPSNQAQTATVQTASSAQAQAPSPEPSATAGSLGSAQQDAKNLLDDLHKILSILRHNDNRSSIGKPFSASGRTGDRTAVRPTQATKNVASTDAQAQTSVPATTAPEKTSGGTPQTASTTSSAVTDVANTNCGDSSASAATPPLSDVVAEILTLMQLVVQALQQTQITSGGTVGVATTQSSDLASASAPLLELLQTAEKNAGELLKDFTQTSPADNSAVLGASVATRASSSTDTVAQLGQLNADLQNVLAALQQQAQGEAEKTSTPAAQEATVGNAAQIPISTATTVEPLVVPAVNKNATPDATKVSTAAAVTAAVSTATAPATIKITVPPNKAPETAVTLSTNGVLETTAMPTESTSAEATAGNLSLNLQSDGEPRTESDGLLKDGKPFSFADTSAAFGAVTAENAQATGTYSFASSLSAFRAANGGATGLPGVVDQVILQMNRNVKNGQSQMSLQLQPTDLGKITVKLEFGEGGRVQGTVVADNPKTLEMLQKDSRSLERALQDAGLRAEPGSLQFSLGGQKNPNDAGQTAGSGNSGNGKGDGTISADGSDNSGLVDIAAISESYYITPMGVNIQV